MGIKVMKFGGASVKNAVGIRNVGKIIGTHLQEPLCVVVSAIDKTTNHLEKLAYLARDGQETDTWIQFEAVKSFHSLIINDIFSEETANSVFLKVKEFFGEIERIVKGIFLLEEFSPRTYDRIVSYGELLSTTIVSEYLLSIGHNCLWLDARRLIKTDSTYTSAEVIWTLTMENIQRDVLPNMGVSKVVLTQGFIGSNTENKTTTLGREGSDYTASIFAHCLDADSVSVWKDVPGILNGDPRIRKETLKLDRLTYEEAVEMTFYGASVIHPKTIKPLFVKKIPLHVKSFLDPTATGSIISNQENPLSITAYINKKDQAFIQITPKDFSFMEERLMLQIFDLISKSGVKVNLVQITAISLLLCVNDVEVDVRELVSLLLDNFEVSIQQNLQLQTITNFTDDDIQNTADALMVQQHGGKLFMLTAY